MMKFTLMHIYICQEFYFNRHPKRGGCLTGGGAKPVSAAQAAIGYSIAASFSA